MVGAIYELVCAVAHIRVGSTCFVAKTRLYLKINALFE